MPFATLACAAAAALVLENPAVDPHAAPPGKVAAWKAADGLLYEYCVPKGYDPEHGANLTLVLHGERARPPVDLLEPSRGRVPSR